MTGSLATKEAPLGLLATTGAVWARARDAAAKRDIIEERIVIVVLIEVEEKLKVV